MVHIHRISRGALQDDHLDEDIHSACLVPGLPVNLDLSRLLQVRSLYRQEVWTEDCQCGGSTLPPQVNENSLLIDILFPSEGFQMLYNDQLQDFLDLALL